MSSVFGRSASFELSSRFARLISDHTEEMEEFIENCKIEWKGLPLNDRPQTAKAVEDYIEKMITKKIKWGEEEKKELCSILWQYLQKLPKYSFEPMVWLHFEQAEKWIGLCKTAWQELPKVKRPQSLEEVQHYLKEHLPQEIEFTGQEIHSMAETLWAHLVALSWARC